jgi:trans-aconitate methyltransferase
MRLDINTSGSFQRPQCRRLNDNHGIHHHRQLGSAHLLHHGSSLRPTANHAGDIPPRSATHRFAAPPVIPPTTTSNRTDVILDLGCGDGILTASIAAQCGHITGVDSSPSMISACKAQPNSMYLCSSAHSLLTAQQQRLPHSQYTKLFSNAALHWILRCPSRQRTAFFAAAFALLEPGGAFVAECGAFGNVAEVHAAVVAALIHRGVAPQRARESSPWWFGSEGDYRNLLQEAGFVVEVLETELRQTELTREEGGGVGGWVRLFAADMLKCLEESQREEAVREVEEALEATGRRGDGGMWVNYVRLRFVARKPVV